MNFIEIFAELFSGTEDCYAISRDWKIDGEPRRAYLPSNYSGPRDGARRIVEEVVSDIGSTTPGIESATAHLTGKHFLGVYPIRSDSTVVFFALDFDKVEEDARKEAKRQQDVFLLEAGIPTYLERSRSGNGYHLWGFLEGPVNAGELRFALAPFIENTDTYDRMFPNQDGTTEAKPYGNLIALPLYGPNVANDTGVFITINADYEVTVVADQKAYLSEVLKIPATDIKTLFDKRTERYDPDLGGRIRKGDPEALEGIYKVIHPDVGCEWIRWCIDNPTDIMEPEWYAMACQFAQLRGGREAFHEASKADPRYDPGFCDEKFDHALEVNAPPVCKWIRDNLNGPACECDSRFLDYKVKHPYDLAKVPFHLMIDQLKLETEPETAFEGLTNALAYVKHIYRNPGAFEGYAYGIPALDEFTELRPNDLIVFAARPGRGKTAFMIDIAYRLALDGIPVYIYSMEMSKDQLWKRMLSRIAQVDGNRLNKGDLIRSELKRLLKAQKVFDKLPIIVDDTTYDSVEVVNKAAAQIAEFGKGVVMIDYLQMATNHPLERNYEKVSRVSREYKLLAKGMEVPVFALAQMNREGEDLNEDSETLDSVLEGSGKIEQYADVIIFQLGLRRPGIVRRTLVLHKERHREAGHRIKLDFNQPVMTFDHEGAWTVLANQINAQTKQNTPTNARKFFS